MKMIILKIIYNKIYNQEKGNILGIKEINMMVK